MLGWKSHEKETEKWQQKQVSAVAEKPMRRDVSRPSHVPKRRTRTSQGHIIHHRVTNKRTYSGSPVKLSIFDFTN